MSIMKAIMVDSVSYNTYRYDFVGSIDEEKDYSELFELLAGATENDAIVLRINSPGGSVNIGYLIVDALRSSKAHSVAHVMIEASSMASLIALACTEIYLTPNSYLMFHAAATGYEGKLQDIQSFSQHNLRVTQGLFNDWASPFLTKKELDKIWQGHELYVGDNDPSLEARIKRHMNAKR